LNFKLDIIWDELGERERKLKAYGSIWENERTLFSIYTHMDVFPKVPFDFRSFWFL
jgi:hypothetical protein